MAAPATVALAARVVLPPSRRLTAVSPRGLSLPGRRNKRLSLRRSPAGPSPVWISAASSSSVPSTSPDAGSSIGDALGGVEIYSAATGEPVLFRDLWDQNEGMAVVALLRHFGCPCCWELASVLRDTKEKFDSAGVKLIAVGVGSPAKARILGERLPFPLEYLYADPERKAQNSELALGCFQYCCLDVHGIGRRNRVSMPNRFPHAPRATAANSEPLPSVFSGNRPALTFPIPPDASARLPCTPAAKRAGGGDCDALARWRRRRAYDLLGLYFGIGRTFFNPASVKVFSRFDSLKEAVKNYTIEATPDDRAGVLQQGGMFVFKGKELIYARKDEGTGDHAPLDDVLNICCKVPVS